MSGGVRVVSLVPSVTETLLAWGVEPVAVTRFCEQPGYPVVGGTKTPDVAAIVDLQPDLVVMDREENRAKDAAALEAAGISLHVLHVRSLSDVEPALAGLAAEVGYERPRPRPAGKPDAAEPVLRAWVPIWRRPWMSINAATYGSSILAAVGVANILADAVDPYPTVTLEQVAAHRPDVVLAPSEPYEFKDRHRAELESVAPVIFVDGKDLFWWGARTPHALSRLRTAAAAWHSGRPPGSRSEGS